MQQLTNNEIARVFAMYMGRDCFCNFGVLETVSGYTIDKVETFGLGYGQLVLTPLSAITEEHSIQIGELLGYGQTPTRPSFVARVKGKSFIEYWSDNFGNANPVITTAIFQYLIQQGYAVPLFISFNHPLNNKTAIELGIAIDATTIK